MLKRIKYIFTGLLLLFLIACICLLVSNTIALRNNQLSSFFGYSISYVKTESMSPTIEVGDTVLIKKCSMDDVDEGDIIVYFDGQKYIIHRVYEITEDGIITKGDNNNTNPIPDDILITDENLYGVYVKTVNYLNLTSIINNRNYIFPACILVFFLILISEAVHIAKLLGKKAREDIEQNQKEELKKELLEEIKREIENERDND